MHFYSGPPMHFLSGVDNISTERSGLMSVFIACRPFYLRPLNGCSEKTGEAVSRFAMYITLIVAVISTMAGFLSASARAVPLIPTPKHIVVVVMENHSFDEIANSGKAPFITYLAKRSAIFTNSFAVAKPSQPNYLALFSGSTHGIIDNGFHTLRAPTLASALREVGKNFIGYVERGSPRKHNPWKTFAGLQGVERDFAMFPSDFNKLPDVSFVIPNLDHNMHDGSVEQGDDWLKRHLGMYIEWCVTQNDLLILTFDEDNGNTGNHIFTVFVSGLVKPGRYDEKITHYSVLRTLEVMHDLPPLEESAKQLPITDVWRPETMQKKD